jgi:predicted ATPase/DNA-binding CsgD family transcriptional regulator
MVVYSSKQSKMTFTNLPVQLTSFIGRERELAEVERLVSASRLVTLTGAGGCGKTRLAIQVGNNMSGAFADGIWLIDFVPLREPELVPQHVTQAFDLRPVPNQSLNELLLNFVRPKQMLLILDNCEHLVVGIAQLVQQLLPVAIELNILATSRQPLGIPGEKIYQVQGLAIPQLNSATILDLQALQQYDAVHLFIERARAISPQFRITIENASAIIEICRRLDGIPLALELASARLKILTPQQIAARLDSRFNLLNLGQTIGAVTHHQTLRAAIDWSHDLLNADERTFLRRLSIFDASFSLDAAEGISREEGMTSDRTLDLLASLVDKSLVLAETTGRAEARYRLLETIHEYALEKLKEAGEFKRLRNRHLDFFVVRTEEIVSKMQSSSYPSLWLNWLDGELDNIRLALDWALESGQIESGLRLVITLFDFWISHGSISEGRNWYERLLAKAGEQVPIMLRARANFNAGMTAGFMGDATAARAHERTAVALCEAAGEEGVHLLALAQGPIVVAAIMDRDFLTAYNTVERSVQLLREINDDMELPMSLATQAVSAGGLGRYQIARSLAEESLKAAHKSGNLFAAALIVSYLGYIEHCEQNYERAQALYVEALTALHEQGATREEPRVLQMLGHTRLQQGDLDQAYALICESVARYRSQGELKAMGECLIGFGVLASERGMQTEAVRLLTTGATHGRSVYVSLLLAERREYERYLAAAHSQLREQEFEQAQQEGRAQTLEGAIEYALSLPLATEKTALQSKDEFRTLTAREREIVSLIGQGMTNGEISIQLVLSKRTVEKHVANILSKLELTSRAQIIRWAMEHHLTSTSS